MINLKWRSNQWGLISCFSLLFVDQVVNWVEEPGTWWDIIVLEHHLNVFQQFCQYKFLQIQVLVLSFLLKVDQSFVWLQLKHLYLEQILNKLFHRLAILLHLNLVIKSYPTKGASKYQFVLIFSLNLTHQYQEIDLVYDWEWSMFLILVYLLFSFFVVHWLFSP